MQAEEKDRLIHLCQEAAVESDATRLIELVREINDLMEKKRSQPSGSAESPRNPPSGNVG
jgi:hypothetical protein